MEQQGEETVSFGTAYDHFSESDEVCSLIDALPHVFQDLRSLEATIERLTGLIYMYIYMTMSFMYMYICMYVCVYVCMYVCMYVSIYVHVHMYICIQYLYICMYVNIMYIHVYVYHYIRSLVNLVVILNKYQEQPHLLDPYLGMYKWV